MFAQENNMLIVLSCAVNELNDTDDGMQISPRLSCTPGTLSWGQMVRTAVRYFRQGMDTALASVVSGKHVELQPVGNLS